MNQNRNDYRRIQNLPRSLLVPLNLLGHFEVCDHHKDTRYHHVGLRCQCVAQREMDAVQFVTVLAFRPFPNA